MGILQLPKQLMTLLKEKDTVAEQLKTVSKDWYLSKDGEATYKNAQTLADKTMHIFEYFLATAKEDSDRDVIYKLAYITASYVDGTSLEFAGYQSMLDPRDNPLALYAIELAKRNAQNLVHCIMLLKMIHNEEDANVFLDAKHKPYTHLTYDEGNKTSDMYKLEKAIIGVFCDEYTDKFLPPYKYDIVLSETPVEDDKNEEDM